MFINEMNNTKMLGKFKLNNIYHGDCIALLQDMPNNCIDLVVTDPPFAIDFKGRRSNYNRIANRVIEGYNEISQSDYFEFTLKWMKEATRTLKASGTMYIVSGWTNLRDILNAIEDNKLITLNHLIWKYQFGVYTKKKFVSSHYHILMCIKDKKNYKFRSRIRW